MLIGTRLLPQHWGWFTQQMRPVLRDHSLGMFLVLAGSGAFLVDPLILKWVIDNVLQGRTSRLLVIAIVVIATVQLGELASSAVGQLFSIRAVQNLILTIRVHLFEQASRLSADFHEGTPLGEKLYTLEQDVDQLAEAGSTMIPASLQAISLTVFILAAMLILNFRLSFLLFPFVSLFLIVKRKRAWRLTVASEMACARSSDEIDIVDEHLRAGVQVQLLGAEKIQREVFLAVSTARKAALIERSRCEIGLKLCTTSVVSAAIVVLVGYGGHEVVKGYLSIGGFIAFYTYLTRLFLPLSATADLSTQFARCDASLRRIWKLAAELPTVREAEAPVAVCRTSDESVVLDKVSFRYHSARLILDRLSTSIRLGEVVALVGSSGSGKSTVMRLIARVNDVEGGTVFVHGVDVRQARLSDLRKTVCYVPQETLLLNRSIRDNLLLVRPTASDAEIWSTLDIAELSDTIRLLPRGLETVIGPRGHALSGGERQRLAIARSVLIGASLYLFDESTSALDAESERRIHRNLASQLASKTIIFVSHRMLSIKWVDRILLLDAGTIRASGTHHELFQKEQGYQCLFNHHNSEPGGSDLSSLCLLGDVAPDLYCGNVRPEPGRVTP